MDAKRDWGFAKDYVEGMYLMLQAETPDTYVLATNRTETVRDFVSMSCKAAGIGIEWQGSGESETATDTATGKVIVRAPCFPVYCTKIASRLARTYTDRHSLKEIAREVLNVDMSKAQQSSDWGSAELSEAQLSYAAFDVIYLHEIKAKLDAMLAREGRTELAQACFDFLPVRAALDLSGWADQDIFAHS
jgi:hypothetical protein